MLIQGGTFVYGQGQPDLMAGVPPAVKSALTKGYKQMESERRVKSSDLLPIFNPAGQKKLPKKRGKLQILPPEFDEEELAEDEEEASMYYILFTMDG